MSADKYPCIFSRQMEVIVYSLLKSGQLRNRIPKQNVLFRTIERKYEVLYCNPIELKTIGTYLVLSVIFMCPVRVGSGGIREFQ